jgi:hypothetical protein
MAVVLAANGSWVAGIKGHCQKIELLLLLLTTDQVLYHFNRKFMNSESLLVKMADKFSFEF